MKRSKKRVLVFKLLGFCFGLDISVVKFVVSVIEKITPVPLTTRFVQGIANFRGSAYLCFDITPLLIKHNRHVPLFNQAVVVEGNNKERFAILVEGVRTVAKLGQLKKSKHKALNSNFVLDFFILNKKRVYLIDDKKLFNSKELTDIYFPYRRVQGDKCFFFKHLGAVSDLYELYDKVMKLSEEEFLEYQQRGDFYNWLVKVLGYEQVARDIKNCHGKEEFVTVLGMWLN